MGVWVYRSTTNGPGRGKTVLRLTAAALAVGLLAACVTTPKQAGSGPSYIGRASGKTPLEALSEAKIAAVYRAAVDLVGEQSASANKSRIEQAVRGSENPNAYVFNQTLKILKTGGQPISYEVSIEVNRAALSETLSSLGIAASPVANPPPQPQAAPPKQAESAQPVVASEAQPISPELTARLQRDLGRMTYMVSFAENSGLDPFLVRSATTSADAYLADNGIPYVDSGQVEALRKDQQTVYEQETGKSVSITQWIAQRLHADVYIIIDASVSNTTRDGRYLGSADVTLRIFETSTGSGMGAANYQSIQPSVSLTSSKDAVANALQSSVYKGMGEAVGQARAFLTRDLASGIAYDLIVLNTPDDRAMNAFMKNLSLRVGDVRLVSWSAQETRYRVTLSGTASDLQDLVYETSAAVPGFSGMGMVTLRGRELTFDTGM